MMAKIVSTPFGFSLTHRDLEVSAKALLLSKNISTSNLIARCEGGGFWGDTDLKKQILYIWRIKEMSWIFWCAQQQVIDLQIFTLATAQRRHFLFLNVMLRKSSTTIFTLQFFKALLGNCFLEKVECTGLITYFKLADFPQVFEIGRKMIHYSWKMPLID